MVSGSAAAVLLIGILIGAVLLGGLIGAGIDFISGNQGWWGAVALMGMMTAVIVDTVLVQRRAGARR